MFKSLGGKLFQFEFWSPKLCHMRASPTRPIAPVNVRPNKLPLDANSPATQVFPAPGIVTSPDALHSRPSAQSGWGWAVLSLKPSQAYPFLLLGTHLLGAPSNPSSGDMQKRSEAQSGRVYPVLPHSPQVSPSLLLRTHLFGAPGCTFSGDMHWRPVAQSAYISPVLA